MGQGYQDRDFEIIDYQLYELPGFGRPFRGPRADALNDGEFLVCLGAAQTFGCYVEKPYPELLGTALGLPVMNMGVAGAGPDFFLQRRHFLDLANRARLAVVQVMSGRSESNSLFSSKGGEMLTRRADGVSLGAAPAWQHAMKELSSADLAALVEETRANWCRHMRELIQSLEIPVVLLWFSVRTPEYTADPRNVHTLFGDFPQLIDRNMFDLVASDCDAVVELVSNTGLPQRLRSRFTGDATAITMRKDLGGGEKRENNYYPSPEMHSEVAAALLPSCRKLISRHD